MVAIARDRGTEAVDLLEDAFHSRLPVEGRVEKAVKGGYEVRIAGQRAADGDFVHVGGAGYNLSNSG